MKKMIVAYLVVGILLAVHSIWASEQKVFTGAQITQVQVGFATSNYNGAHLEIRGNDGNAYVTDLGGSDALSKVFQLAHEIKNCASIVVRYENTDIATKKNLTNYWISIR